MFSSPKMELIFSIVTALNKIEYKFKNGVVLEILEKLVIAAINPLIYYLIAKVSYARPLLITKLIFMGLEFEVPEEASCTYDGPVKLERETKSS